MQEIPHRPRIRRQAGIQAVRWLNRLEEEEDGLDELWPSFEAWLHERPENPDRYFALLRSRAVVHELMSRCPREGSGADDRLLRRLAKATKAYRARLALVKWLATTVIVMVGIVVYVLTFWRVT